jgi:glycosyltransferase involved in cell wall biosynthesis
MLKIALFHNLPSGGAKRTLSEQCKRLSKRHSIDVYTLSSAEHNYCDIRLYTTKYQVFPFQAAPLLRSPFGRINALMRLLDILRLRQIESHMASVIEAGNYDVVYVQPCQYTNSPALLRYLLVPTVFYCHETLRRVYDPPLNTAISKRSFIRKSLDRIDPTPGLYLKVLKNEDRRNLMPADCVLVNSRFSKERFRISYGYEAHVCYHGVDVIKFLPNELDRKGYVLSVGAIRPDKGFEFIIRSLSLIPQEDRPAIYIIANHSNSQYANYLDNLAQELFVNLEIHTMISDEELVKTYNTAQMTVYAPIMEPFGLVPLESMACGTPVVGVAEGGVKETVVDGLNGRLVERDPETFAQVVRESLGNPDLLSKYGRHARRYVIENWSWEKSVQCLESYLIEAADKS